MDCISLKSLSRICLKPPPPKGENHPNYGKRCYNNGIKEKFLSQEEEIPAEYILGGLPTSEETGQNISKARNSINYKHNIRVITSLCCYFSMKDAIKE